uniref:PA domain-containing protein n=1 Tax=Globisporangium ultimum (strain ATCC 200006 / CBS 805.95 / DAOM BR144) TaxID=431595 RepID=K3WPA8_GLOUD
MSIATTSAPAFPCQAAAFGGYIHPGTTQYRVVVAWDGAQLACEPFEEEGDERVYHDAIVVVQRGRCSFQEKWHNVARAGGSGMLLVNSEDTLLQLGGIAYDGSSDTMALSIAKADTESLLESLHAHSQQRNNDTTYLSIALPMSRLEQAAARIQYLLQTNMPLIAYEYFMDELAASSSPMILRDFDALLASLTQHAERSTWIAEIDNVTSWFVLFKLCALLFPSQYEFASTAALHASVAAVSLLLQAPHVVTKENKHNELWERAAKKLVDAGYYNQSAFYC